LDVISAYCKSSWEINDTLIIRSGYVALTPDSDGTMITACINENFSLYQVCSEAKDAARSNARTVIIHL
jgi:hypothetical protein